MLTVLEVVCYIFGVNKSMRKTQVLRKNMLQTVDRADTI
mgnify:FL=1